jgi:hypothetical protein
MTTKEVARRFQLNEETIRRWYRSGKLKGECTSKKKGIIFDEQDVLQFIKDNPKYKISYTANERPVLLDDIVAAKIEMATRIFIENIRAILRNEKLQ